MQDILSITSTYCHGVGFAVMALITVRVSYKMYMLYTEDILLDKVSQVEAARAQEGLPSNVRLTSEDFRLNPELANIFEAPAEGPLIIPLETNAHLELLQHQEAIINQHWLMDFIEAFINAFNNFL